MGLMKLIFLSETVFPFMEKYCEQGKLLVYSVLHTVDSVVDFKSHYNKIKEI